MLVLDSNTISYYFRGDAQVVPRMQALPPADLGVPAIVEYELRYGLLRLAPEAAEPRLAALAQLLRPMQLLPFDSECAAHAARIRAALEAAGASSGNTERGAVGGALLGAAAGAIIGNNTGSGDAGQGAAIGAGAGAIAGGVAGASSDHNRNNNSNANRYGPNGEELIFDRNSDRYYYVDRRSGRTYWANGEYRG